MGGNRKLFAQGTHRLVAHDIRALVGMMMVMMPAMSRLTRMAAGVCTAFWNKGLKHAFDTPAQMCNHVGKHRIGFDVGRILAQHRPYMAIGQVVDDTHELQGTGGAYAQQFLIARAHLDPFARLSAEDIAMLHRVTTWQNHCHRATIRQHRRQA